MEVGEDMKAVLRRLVPPSVWRALSRNAYIPLKSKLCSSDLIKLACIHGSDKWGEHRFIPHYVRHLQAIRKLRLGFLEIGVGGYDDPCDGGQSLRMWKYYFPNSVINGIDLHRKSIDEHRIRVFQGSQDDESFLRGVVQKIGKLDVVIDDGSHDNRHVRKTFEILFPLLAPGGIYVIEDTHTSYMKEYSGNDSDLNDTSTTMGFVKSLADGLNHGHVKALAPELERLGKEITGVHFYREIVFIDKAITIPCLASA